MIPQADNNNWTLSTAAQNLPAVLNDPTKGKQSNFFVRTWGDAFVEKGVDRSPFLPDITFAHFDTYLRKINKRFKRHLRLAHISHTDQKPRNNNEHTTNLDQVPEIFLRQHFPLEDPAVFSLIFQSNRRENDHQLQEELTHYLDIVEEQIARHVGAQSGAFFHAMTSHDTIMEQMKTAACEVQTLRSKVQKVDKILAKDSLTLIGLARSKSNHSQLADKLKLMSTVLQTQPTLQLLLSSSDYVAALELIASTQQVLSKELAGVTSLRHLPSQLKEMSKLIDKMLCTEFERYAAADLHRPLESSDQGVLEQERLVSLVAGLLRQNNCQFLETYKQEAVTAAQTLLKQLLIEELADVDDDNTEHCLTGSGEAAPTLDATHWLKVLKTASEAFGKLVERVKAVHDVIKTTADSSAGLRPSAQLPTDSQFLTLEDHNRVELKLRDLLVSVCDNCHERLASFITTSQSDKQTMTPLQITALSTIVDQFGRLTETICGRASVPLRAAFKSQSLTYIQRFHNHRKEKLRLLLEAERWKSADVPERIQYVVDALNESTCWPDLGQSHSNSNSKTSQDSLKIGVKSYATVGTVLILIQLVGEYCSMATTLQFLAPQIARYLTDLLKLFNSVSCQLVLGAGALKTAGLKTITTTSLALTSRSLQVVLWLVPHVRRHFAALTNDAALTGLDSVERDIGHHVQQLESKILSIVNSQVGEQLNEWDGRPPVPSTAFRNVSRLLKKLHEAVSAVLPEEQVTDIYEEIHKKFKSRLRDQLVKMNIQNNGSPQHGVVISEILFYMEVMKHLKVLPAKYLSDNAMDDIWTK